MTAVQQIGNRPIVSYALDALRSAGAREIAVVLPPEAADEIQATLGAEDGAGVELTYVPQGERRDVVGALAAAVDFVGEDPCVSHLADGILGRPLASFTGLLRDGFPDLVVLLQRGGQGAQRLPLATRRLLGIEELDPSRSALGLAGAALFGAGGLKRAYGPGCPPDAELDLVGVAERIRAAGGQLQVGPALTWHRYRGNPSELLEMNRMVLDGLPPDTETIAADGNRIDGRVVIHPTAKVQSSLILGPVVIGADAQIEDAYIGPYTSVGDYAQIKGAEIERSIILSEAQIMYLGERIQASVIGRGARISRGFGLPRAIRMFVGDGATVSVS